MQAYKLTINHVKWLLATFLAWTFDLYDLFIILLITPYIAELFFPSKIPYLAIAATYAGFLSSLIVRPFGAAYFGTKIADKLGRRKAIIYGITGLVITTFLQGTLPTYAMAGIVAPILLILLRLAQGFFVGGVTSGSNIIGPESVPERHRGWVGSFGFSSAGAAYLIASGWFYVTAITFPGSSYLEWGWRVMFFGGLFPLAVLAYILHVVPESEIFQRVKHKGKLVKSPIKELFSTYRKQLTISLTMAVGWGLVYYIPQGLFPTFLARVNGLSRPEIAVVLALASLGVIIGPTIGGELSQHIGRKTVFLIGGILSSAIAAPLFLYLGSLTSSNFNTITLVAFLISFFAYFGAGAWMSYVNEIYPTAIRGTGVAFTWNTGFGIGGTSPTIISLILAFVGGTSAFPSIMFYSVLIAGLVVIIASVITPETKGNITKEIESVEKERA